jgi:hypothetical protein
VPEGGTLGGEMGPPRRQRRYASSPDCAFFQGKQCIRSRSYVMKSKIAISVSASRRLIKISMVVLI